MTKDIRPLHVFCSNCFNTPAIGSFVMWLKFWKHDMSGNGTVPLLWIMHSCLSFQSTCWRRYFSQKVQFRLGLLWFHSSHHSRSQPFSQTNSCVVRSAVKLAFNACFVYHLSLRSDSNHGGPVRWITFWPSCLPQWPCPPWSHLNVYHCCSIVIHYTLYGLTRRGLTRVVL